VPRLTIRAGRRGAERSSRPPPGEGKGLISLPLRAAPTGRQAGPLLGPPWNIRPSGAFSTCRGGRDIAAAHACDAVRRPRWSCGARPWNLIHG
jgi:hypothetical protein